MYTVAIVLRMLDRLSDRAAERVIEALLDALALANLEYLRANPGTPSLYRSGVRYADDDGPLDEWRDIPSVLSHGEGDCDDLVPWRLAELWNSGHRNARSIAHLQRAENGQDVFHALIRVEGNQTEDPSRILGMR